MKTIAAHTYAHITHMHEPNRHCQVIICQIQKWQSEPKAPCMNIIILNNMLSIHNTIQSTYSGVYKYH